MISRDNLEHIKKNQNRNRRRTLNNGNGIEQVEEKSRKKEWLQ